MIPKAFLVASCCTWLFSTPSQGDDGEALRNAARRGDVSEVQALLASGVDVNAASSYGVTPMAMACDHGHAEVVRALLAAGADVNTKDSFYKFSPVAWAAMRKNPEIVRLLIDAGANDLDTVLSNAVATQDLAIVESILAVGKPKESALATALRSGKTIKSRMDATKPEAMATIDKILMLLRERMTEEARTTFDKSEADQELAKRWKEYEGTYKNDTSSVTIKAVDGQLTANEGDSERSIPLATSEQDTFTARGMDIQFVRVSDVIQSLTWKAGESERQFQRVAESSAASDVESTATPSNTFEDFPLESIHWPQFRGPLARGIANGSPLPTTWNGTDGTHIAWKTPIPGLGTSSPIVWGDRVFVTTAVQESDASGFRTGPYGDVESVESAGECSYRTLCIDRNTGMLLWDREAAHKVPQVKRHAKSSHANPTPATDGQHVIALFGEAGLYCYDMQGTLQWSRDLGMLDSGWFYDRSYQWGFGSSPCIFEDSVIVQCDAQDGAFITALDLKTGETRWQTAREEIPTWSSPVAFIAKDGTPTVIATGTKCSAGYHARTGECLWTMGGFSEIVVPTPQILPEMAVLTSGYAPVQPVLVLRHTARGSLTIPDSPTPESPFMWAQMRGGPYMPTPIVTNQMITILDNAGILTGLDLSSGKRLFRQRLRAEKANAYTASPVASGEHMYCTSEEGWTFVVAMDGKGTIVAQNELGEAVLSTPAISQGKILIRGEKHLFCIE